MSYLYAGKHSNVKLSVKYSNHKTLTFLDCNVTINQDKFSTSIFRKKIKTFTGPGTNYYSFINSSFINNSVSTLNIFITNYYPQCIFDNTLHKFLYIIFSSKIKPATAKKKLIYIFLFNFSGWRRSLQ